MTTYDDLWLISYLFISLIPDLISKEHLEFYLIGYCYYYYYYYFYYYYYYFYYYYYYYCYYYYYADATTAVATVQQLQYNDRLQPLQSFQPI